MNIIKRKLLLLAIITLVPITISSATILSGTEPDSTVSITHKELKEINLIFLEHKKLLTENNLLLEQIRNYELSSRASSLIDSLRVQQLDEYNRAYQESLEKQQQLSKELNKKKRTLFCWKIGGISISTAFLIFLLLK